MIDFLEVQPSPLLLQSKVHQLEEAADDLTKWAGDLGVDLPLKTFVANITGTAKAAYIVAESMQNASCLRSGSQEIQRFSVFNPGRIRLLDPDI